MSQAILDGSTFLQNIENQKPLHRGESFLRPTVLQIFPEGTLASRPIQEILLLGRGQKELSQTLGSLKSILGFKKKQLVTYVVAGHFLFVRDRNNSIEKRYDLWADGLGKGWNALVSGGGGVKQIFSDHGVSRSDEQVRYLVENVLPHIGIQLKKIVGIEEERYWWDWRKGPLDFSFKGECLQMRRVFEWRRKGVFMEILKELGLINEDRCSFEGPILSASGVEALLDIRKALLLQQVVLECLSEREGAIKMDRRRLARLGVGEMGNIERLTRREKLKTEKMHLNLVKKEMRKGINYSILHFILMELNATMEDWLFPKKWRLLQEKERRPKKWLLPIFPKKKSSQERDLEPRIRMLEEESSSFKSSEEKWSHWDSLRNDVIDRIAFKIAVDFKRMALEEPVSKSRAFLWMLRHLKRNPQDRSPEEAEAIANDLGALIYDVAWTPSATPSRLRKIEFLQKRGWKTQRRCRAMEFLIQGVIFSGEANLGGFYREEESIQRALLKSLERFKQRVSTLEMEEGEEVVNPLLHPKVKIILKEEKKIQKFGPKKEKRYFFNYLILR